MAYTGPSSARKENDGFAGLRTEGREAGTRRKKLAGYLKAANEMRQSYTQGWANRDGDGSDGMPGAFPDTAVISKNGQEELILFPSYARRHVKSKPTAVPGSIQEVPGTGRDYRDSVGAGDAEYWKEQWEQYENDKAVVDVDVRGWLFTPHNGQLNRKQRLMVALARQLVGIPAPPSKGSPGTSAASSRSSSPTRGRTNREEELAAAREADAIVRKGEAEADVAGIGGFSEQPSKDTDADSLYDSPSHSPVHRSREGSTSERSASRASTLQNDQLESIIPVQKRSSWSGSQKMSAAELATANANLMTRLKPFMANPMGNTSISAFFYNEQMSRQRTITTDASGHFSIRAALDFVPTHVRILGSEKLSIQEEIKIVDPRGVSLVSDIDDTVRHSAITKGAREIFRNAFIRDLGDLTVAGVKEWYNTLYGMGVQVHYVSNSPWQLYPILTSFFALAGLPQGSFHLKQYSGMLQGIFEPVAERKKATLDRIMRDFPERRFVLVGDSGEADLEVYTDVVMEHPGRVIAVFIRDVTTPPSQKFFDPWTGPSGGASSSRPPVSRNESAESLTTAKRFSRPSDIEDDDHELRAAIAASLKDMEEEAARDRRAIFSDQPALTQMGSGNAASRPSLNARRPTAPPAFSRTGPGSPLGDLIDFSEEPNRSASSLLGAHLPARPSELLQREFSAPVLNFGSPKPPPPSKPPKLRTLSNAAASPTAGSMSGTQTKPPPPKPRKPSTSVQPVSPSPLSQVQDSSPVATRAPPLPTRQTYRGTAMKKLTAAYNAIPSAQDVLGSSAQTAPYSTDSQQDLRERSLASVSPTSPEESRDAANGKRMPPPPPPRRKISSYPGAAASYGPAFR